MYIIYNSYLPVIGVHEMHGRMPPITVRLTILLVVDRCSSLAYFMMTQPLPIAGKFPIKTLVARQLPTNSTRISSVGVFTLRSQYVIHVVVRLLLGVCTQCLATVLLGHA